VKAHAGVVGYTPSTYGVYGYTTSGSGTGVIGASTTGVGVAGSSSSGDAVYGSATTGTGLFGSSISGHGVGGFGSSNSSAGVYGQARTSYGVYGTTSSGDGYGVLGNVTDAGIGVYGGSPNGYGLEGQSGNLPLVLKNPAGTIVFQVDAAGNTAFSGNLLAIARTPGGQRANAFSARTTQPTIEDTGTARLVDGKAVVALDAAFSATIERAAKYRVFLTADGETHELYVAAKTPASFTIREAQGGRSTVDVDYRIVATVAGQSGQRMNLTRAAEPRVARVPSAVAVAPLAARPVLPPSP
jgi:hypothetical protein